LGFQFKMRVMGGVADVSTSWSANKQ